MLANITPFDVDSSCDWVFALGDSVVFRIYPKMLWTEIEPSIKDTYLEDSIPYSCLHLPAFQISHSHQRPFSPPVFFQWSNHPSLLSRRQMGGPPLWERHQKSILKDLPVSQCWNSSETRNINVRHCNGLLWGNERQWWLGSLSLALWLGYCRRLSDIQWLNSRHEALVLSDIRYCRTPTQRRMLLEFNPYRLRMTLLAYLIVQVQCNSNLVVDSLAAMKVFHKEHTASIQIMASNQENP